MATRFDDSNARARANATEPSSATSATSRASFVVVMPRAGRRTPLDRTRDLGARTVDAVRDADPFAFGANANALFDDVDAETLAEEEEEERDDDADARGRATATRGVGVSVFEKVRREKASAARAEAKAARGETKTNGIEARETMSRRRRGGDAARDAFDDPAVEAGTMHGNCGDDDDDDDDDGDDDDDVVVVAEGETRETSRPAEDLFDEIAAPSPNKKRATREPKTLSRAIAKKRARVATNGSSDAPSTSRPAPAPAVKRKKVTLTEFAGEEQEDGLERYGDGDDDESGAMMPRSGAQLADIDEANYAVSGLSSVRDVKEKIRSVGVLVNLLGNQRTRRLLASYGIPIKIVRAAQDAAMSALAPKTLQSARARCSTSPPAS